MLEGESLLNDATALVLLRTMVAAVAVARPARRGGRRRARVHAGLRCGACSSPSSSARIVGYLNLRLRALISHSAANTAIGFVVPFVAYLPTEQLGGSGLVAAVVAGIVTGQGAARWFTPEQRLSDELNWRTIELVLEGARLPAHGTRAQGDRRAEPRGPRRPRHRHRARRSARSRSSSSCARRTSRCSSGCRAAARAGKQRTRLEAIERAHRRRSPPAEPPIRDARRPRRGRGRGARAERPAAQRRHRVDAHAHRARARATSTTTRHRRSGWKHGTVIVWAGMRGVVTLAAAQTLPAETPERALLVFVAFARRGRQPHAAGLHAAVARAAAALRAHRRTTPSTAPSRRASTRSCGMPRHPRSSRLRPRAARRHRRSRRARRAASARGSSEPPDDETTAIAQRCARAAPRAASRRCARG